YLLAGKTWCVCGRRRTGEGPQHGKYLYYRCTNRIHNFPLPSTCAEKGINARIADKLVWEKIAKLMSSPELLAKQIKRWLSHQQNGGQDSAVAIEGIRNQIIKLKEKEDRYEKAYGAGLFSIEKLKEHVSPIRDELSSLGNQISKAQSERGRLDGATLPQLNEIGIFAKKAVKGLQNLNFGARQAIVRNVIEKVVGTQKELQVYGFIPVEINNNGSFCSIHRYRGTSKRGEIHTL
ncbi:MAG: recombinase zinc beta ribbon domain-containing protein, partial [Minisyncoccia bacterium]